MSARTKGRVGLDDLDATRGQLEQVGLMHAAARLAELVEEPVKDDLPAHGFLDRLLAAESFEREMRRIATSLRLSGLPPGQTLGTSISPSSPRWRRDGSRRWPRAPGCASTPRCSSRARRV